MKRDRVERQEHRWNDERTGRDVIGGNEVKPATVAAATTSTTADRRSGAPRAVAQRGNAMAAIPSAIAVANLGIGSGQRRRGRSPRSVRARRHPHGHAVRDIDPFPSLGHPLGAGRRTARKKRPDVDASNEDHGRSERTKRRSPSTAPSAAFAGRTPAARWPAFTARSRLLDGDDAAAPPARDTSPAKRLPALRACSPGRRAHHDSENEPPSATLRRNVVERGAIVGAERHRGVLSRPFHLAAFGSPFPCLRGRFVVLTSTGTPMVGASAPDGPTEEHPRATGPQTGTSCPT